MVQLPVVLECAPAGGEDLQVMAASGKASGDLEDVLLRSSDEVAPEPGDDERRSVQARRPKTA